MQDTKSDKNTSNKKKLTMPHHNGDANVPFPETSQKISTNKEYMHNI